MCCVAVAGGRKAVVVVFGGKVGGDVAGVFPIFVGVAVSIRHFGIVKFDPILIFIFIFVVGVCRSEVVKLSHFEHLRFGGEADHAVPFVAHMGLYGIFRGTQSVAVEAFLVFGDFGVEIGEQAFEIGEVGLFGDECAVGEGHVGEVEGYGGGCRGAEEAVGEVSGWI